MHFLCGSSCAQNDLCVLLSGCFSVCVRLICSSDGVHSGEDGKLPMDAGVAGKMMHTNIDKIHTIAHVHKHGGYTYTESMCYIYPESS